MQNPPKVLGAIGAPSMRNQLNKTNKFNFQDLASSNESNSDSREVSDFQTEPKEEDRVSVAEEEHLSDRPPFDRQSQPTNESCSQTSQNAFRRPLQEEPSIGHNVQFHQFVEDTEQHESPQRQM
jgi:hypothetical protein